MTKQLTREQRIKIIKKRMIDFDITGTQVARELGILPTSIYATTNLIPGRVCRRYARHIAKRLNLSMELFGYKKEDREKKNGTGQRMAVGKRNS
jgi:hypothetical protein